MGMRRFLVYIFAVLYLGLSSGVTLNLHYCMGKLAEVSLWHLDSCPACGETCCGETCKPHPCCSTETEYVKLSIDQEVGSTSVQPSAPVAVALLFDLFDSCLVAGRDEPKHFYPFLSPPKEAGDIPLFVYHCTFLI